MKVISNLILFRVAKCSIQSAHYTSMSDSPSILIYVKCTITLWFTLCFLPSHFKYHLLLDFKGNM